MSHWPEQIGLNDEWVLYKMQRRQDKEKEPIVPQDLFLWRVTFGLSWEAAGDACWGLKRKESTKSPVTSSLSLHARTKVNNRRCSEHSRHNAGAQLPVPCLYLILSYFFSLVGSTFPVGWETFLSYKLLVKHRELLSEAEMNCLELAVINVCSALGLHSETSKPSRNLGLYKEWCFSHRKTGMLSSSFSPTFKKPFIEKSKLVLYMNIENMSEPVILAMSLLEYWLMPQVSSGWICVPGTARPACA